MNKPEDVGNRSHLIGMPEGSAKRLEMTSAGRSSRRDRRVGALVVVLAGWVVGRLAGEFLATLISRRRPGMQALVLGILLTLAGVANNLMLPPPNWFWIATFLVFLPSTFAGAARAAGV